MSVYVIALREDPVHDAAEMAEYGRKARETGDFKQKPLAIYGTLDSLEGRPADGVAILEFPTADDARNWYFSEAYQDAAQHRHKAANYRIMMVEGLAL